MAYFFDSSESLKTGNVGKFCIFRRKKRETFCAKSSKNKRRFSEEREAAEYLYPIKDIFRR